MLGGGAAERLAFLGGGTLVGLGTMGRLVAMFLEVLVCATILDELCGTGQLIWVLIKRDRLDNIS